MKRPTYTVRLPAAPGVAPSVRATARTLVGARAKALRLRGGRHDLAWQDVRIDLAGRFVEYAGPVCR